MFIIGPKTAEALQRVTKEDLDQFSFFEGGEITIDGKTVYAQRSGYTGEDGFEVSFCFS